MEVDNTKFSAEFGTLGPCMHPVATQTLSTLNLVREVLGNMVLECLQAKGFTEDCPHTKGLELDDVISGIVDSHNAMCVQKTQKNGSQLQRIPVEGIGDDHLTNVHKQNPSSMSTQSKQGSEISGHGINNNDLVNAIKRSTLVSNLSNQQLGNQNPIIRIHRHNQIDEVQVRNPNEMPSSISTPKQGSGQQDILVQSINDNDLIIATKSSTGVCTQSNQQQGIHNPVIRFHRHDRIDDVQVKNPTDRSSSISTKSTPKQGSEQQDVSALVQSINNNDLLKAIGSSECNQSTSHQQGNQNPVIRFHRHDQIDDVPVKNPIERSSSMSPQSSPKHCPEQQDIPVQSINNNDLINAINSSTGVCSQSNQQQGIQNPVIRFHRHDRIDVVQVKNPNESSSSMSPQSSPTQGPEQQDIPVQSINNNDLINAINSSTGVCSQSNRQQSNQNPVIRFHRHDRIDDVQTRNPNESSSSMSSQSTSKQNSEQQDVSASVQSINNKDLLKPIKSSTGVCSQSNRQQGIQNQWFRFHRHDRIDDDQVQIQRSQDDKAVQKQTVMQKGHLHPRSPSAVSLKRTHTSDTSNINEEPGKKVSILSAGNNIHDLIERSLKNKECWVCGKHIPVWTDFVKHVSEEHKEHLEPDQGMEHNDQASPNGQTTNQSFGHKDQTTPQSKAQKDQATGQSKAQKDQATGQSKAQKDQTTTQSKAQKDQATGQSSTSSTSKSASVKIHTVSQPYAQKEQIPGQLPASVQMYKQTNQTFGKYPQKKVQAVEHSPLVQKDSPLVQKDSPLVQKDPIANQSGAQQMISLPSCSAPVTTNAHREFKHGVLKSPINTIKCHVCKQEFSNWQSLLVHMKEQLHTEQKVMHLQPKEKMCLKCDLCEDTFIEPEQLNAHLEFKHGVLKIRNKCLVCSLEMSSWQALLEHIKEKLHSEEEIMQIRQIMHLQPKETLQPEDEMCLKCCEATFIKPEQLNVHLQFKHGVLKTSNWCFVCNLKFSNWQALQAHMKEQTHKEKMPFKCELCMNTFMESEQLRAHLEFKHKVMKTRWKSLRCIPCDLEFCNWQGLLAHRIECELHIEEEVIHLLKEKMCLKCDLCEDTFIKPKQLNAHLEFKHGALKTSNKCIVCNLEMSSWQALLVHMKENLHREEEAIIYFPLKEKMCLKCYLCTDTFIDMERLNEHLKFKHGVLKKMGLKCDLCEDTFIKPEQLNAHLEFKHGALKTSNKCLVCGLKFSNWQALLVHMKEKMHTEEEIMHLQPKEKMCLKCYLCTDTFIDMEQLNEHLKFKHGVLRSIKFRGPGDLEFSNQQALQAYMVEKNYIDEKGKHLELKGAILKCKLCPWKKHVLDNFFRHLQTHFKKHHGVLYTAEQNKCLRCNLDFKHQKEALIDHMKQEHPVDQAQIQRTQDDKAIQKPTAMQEGRLHPPSPSAVSRKRPFISDASSDHERTGKKVSILSPGNNIHDIEQSHNKEWTDFVKQVSEGHKEQLAPEQQMEHKDQTHSQSFGQKHQTSNQSPGQLSTQKDQGTSCPTAEKDLTITKPFCQKGLATNQFTNQEDNTINRSPGQSSTQKDQGTSCPTAEKDLTVQEDNTISQSYAQKDQGTRGTTYSKPPAQKDQATGQPSAHIINKSTTENVHTVSQPHEQREQIPFPIHIYKSSPLPFQTNQTLLGKQHAQKVQVIDQSPLIQTDYTENHFQTQQPLPLQAYSAPIQTTLQLSDQTNYTTNQSAVEQIHKWVSQSAVEKDPKKSLSAAQKDKKRSKSAAQKDKKRNQSAVQKDQIRNQSAVQKYQTGSQLPTPMIMLTDQSQIVQIATNQSALQMNKLVIQSTVQKDTKMSQSTPQKDQTKSQSAVQKDQTGNQSAAQKDHLSSQSNVRKDCTSSQSAVQKYKSSNQSRILKTMVIKSNEDEDGIRREFRCWKCQNKFASYTFLTQHLKQFHNIVIELLPGRKSDQKHQQTANQSCSVITKPIDQSGIVQKHCQTKTLPWSGIDQHLNINFAPNNDEGKKRPKTEEASGTNVSEGESKIKNAVLGNRCWVCQGKFNDFTLLTGHLKLCHNIALGLLDDSKSDQKTSQLAVQEDQASSRSAVQKEGSQLPTQMVIQTGQSQIGQNTTNQSGLQIHKSVSQSPLQKDQTANQLQNNLLYVSCDFCSSLFLPTEINEHLIRIHGALRNKDYTKCLVCTLKFEEWTMLVEHIKTEHKACVSR